MAVLSETERMEIWRWLALTNREAEIDSLRRIEFRGAIDATDDWVVANAASFNSALPQTARQTLTAPQKALLLSHVARRRALLRPLVEMSEEDRDHVYQEMISKNPGAEVLSLQPADLRAAVDASDDWIIEHAQAFNAALPQPARGILKTHQKADMFALVVRWRWLVDA